MSDGRFERITAAKGREMGHFRRSRRSWTLSCILAVVAFTALGLDSVAAKPWHNACEGGTSTGDLSSGPKYWGAWVKIRNVPGDRSVTVCWDLLDPQPGLDCTEGANCGGWTAGIEDVGAGGPGSVFVIDGGSSSTGGRSVGRSGAGLNVVLWIAGNDIVGNTGDTTFPTSANQIIGSIDVPSIDDVLAKERKVQELLPRVLEWYASGATGMPSTQSPDCGEACGTFKLNQPVRPQEKKYTCGPASGRLVLYQMNGSDPGEKPLESAMDTTSDGTYIGNIAPTINPRVRNPGPGDSFYVESPGDPETYLSMVVADVYYYGHGLINNVDTKTLPWFQGRSLRHYDVTYGYTSGDSSPRIYVAEEWDPSKFYSNWGDLYNNKNPYGYKSATLSQMWAAIAGNKGMVVW